MSLRKPARAWLTTMSLVAGFCTAPAVSAATYQFTCIPDSLSSLGDCSIAQTQIEMDVVSLATNQVAFTFRNAGPGASSVEGIYFDDGTLLGISSVIDKDDGTGGLSGVDFTAGSAAPPELPRAHNLSPTFETTAGFLADADAPTVKNGVNPDEWVTIVFALQSGGTYEDVVTELSNGELRVGLHVIGFESGGSESLVNEFTPVPVPAAFWLLASGLVGLGVFRKKG